MTAGRQRFLHELTNTSKAVLEQQIKEALDQSGINEQLKSLQKKEEELKKQKEKLKEMDEKRKREIEEEMRKNEEEKKRLEEERRKLQEQKKQEQKQTGGQATAPINNQVSSGGGGGGCFPGSAIFVDIHGRRRRMDSLKVGDEVHVISNENIRLEPVITFIHH